jgi:hypothetical protein
MQSATLLKLDNSFALKTWLAVGWTLLLLILVALSIIFASLWNTISRALSTGRVQKPVHGVPDDSVGFLSASIPTSYNSDTALYLKDSMARYMNYVIGDAPTYVTRPSQNILSIISVGANSDIVSIVIEDIVAKSIVILFKGSTTAMDWEDDFHTNQEALRPTAFPGVKIDSGFQKSYFQSRNSIIDCIKRSSNCSAVYLMGHSLGGAVATICSADLRDNAQEFGLSDPASIYTVTLASPRQGNDGFMRHVEDMQIYQLRNTADIIPCLPLAVQPSLYGAAKSDKFCHAGKGLLFFNPSYSTAGAHMQIAYEKACSLSVGAGGLTQYIENQ